MATYEYRCEPCGPFSAQRPIGTAPARLPCPACERESGRVYTPPLVRQLPSGIRTALTRSEASADTPAVVNRVPSGSAAARRAAHPALARLPRP